MSVSEFTLHTRDDIDRYVGDLAKNGRLGEAELHLSKVLDAPNGELARYFKDSVRRVRDGQA